MGNIGTAQIHLRCFIEKKDNYRIAAEWDICRSSGSLQAEDPAKQVLYRKYPFTTFPFHDTLWKSQARSPTSIMLVGSGRYQGSAI